MNWQQLIEQTEGCTKDFYRQKRGGIRKVLAKEDRGLLGKVTSLRRKGWVLMQSTCLMLVRKSRLPGLKSHSWRRLNPQLG